MKFGKRLGLLAATAALSLAPAIGSLAQGMTCTLAAADCTTLATADANVAKETSFALEFEFSISIKGDSPVEAKASGQGQFAVAPNVNMTDPTALANGLQFALDFTGSSTAPSASNSTASAVVSGGVLYFKSSSQDWQGVNLADAIKLVQAQMAGGAGGLGAMTGGAGAAQYAQMFQNPDMIKALAGLQNIKGFVTEEKTANAPQLENQTMSEFVDTVSPSALLNSPDFATSLKAIMTAVAAANPSAGAASSMNPDQLTAMLPILSSMIGDTNLKITRWVGQTDNLYHAFGLDLNLNVNAAAFGGGSASPTTGTIHFLIKLTKVGQPVTVAAPAGAKMIDLSAMMGGAGALSGGGAIGGSGAVPAASATPS